MRKDEQMKRYQGHTAGGWLRKSTVSEMNAGNFEITHNDLPGCAMYMTSDDELIIHDVDGERACLPASQRACDKARRLDEEIGRRYEKSMND